MTLSKQALDLKDPAFWGERANKIIFATGQVRMTYWGMQLDEWTLRTLFAKLLEEK